MIIVVLFLHLFLLIKSQFTAWPEVVSFPYLISKGFLINKDFIHPYPPLLTYFLLIVYKIFGFKLFVLKLFSYSLILIADVFVYLLVSKLSSKKLALWLTFCYIFAQTFLEGNMLWFDTALVPFLLISVYFLLNNKFLISGLFLAITIFIKQSAIIYLLVFLLAVFLNNKNFVVNLKKILVFPILIGIILLVNFLFHQSVQNNFNWLFYYPIVYWSQFPSYVDFALEKKEIAIVLFLFVINFFLLLNKNKKNILFVLLNISSLIAIYPRFSFFHAQVLIAVSFVSLSLINKKIMFIWLVVFFLLIKSYFVFTKIEDRFWNQKAIDTANIVKQFSHNEKTYFLGPNSLNYVLSQTIPSKPFVDGFGWYWEVPSLAQNTLNSWDSDSPEYIYWTLPREGNWYDLATYQNKDLTKWIENNYNRLDLVWENTYLWQKKN